jgi:hypothetical protein
MTKLILIEPTKPGPGNPAISKGLFNFIVLGSENKEVFPSYGENLVY